MITVRHLVMALGCSVCLAPAVARADLDDLTRRLQTSSADGRWAALSVTADVSAYHVDLPPPGLLLADQETFLAPRLSATVDAGGGRFLGHLRVTADRGFDPLFESHGDLRVDELFVQADISESGRFSARLGKSATVFGAWVGRHLPWDNPLINAPLPYDDMLTITDAAVPADPEAFLARRDQPENKRGWVPMIWGPSYASGGTLLAAFGDVDLALEVKNASLSSRPEDWSPWNRGFDDGLTVTGHGRWRPAPEWTLGLSFSQGAYLREDAVGAAAEAAPAVDDTRQTTSGADIAYEHRNLQLWGEVVHSRFEVPGVGTVAATSAFVEFRHQFATRLWLAGRWNQSWFDDVGDVSWDRDLRAADLGIGFRQSAHRQAKLQYRWLDQQGPDSNGRHVLAAQLVAWF